MRRSPAGSRPERPLRYRYEGGPALRVVRGCAWLTVDGCPKDVVLEPGDEHQTRTGERVIAHALEDTVVMLAAGRTPA